MVYDPEKGCDRTQYKIERFGKRIGDGDVPPSNHQISMPPSTVSSLQFNQLRKANDRRAIEVFGHEAGLEDWSPAEWTNALAGEAGELCNLTKKMLRDGNISREEIGKEIADVVIYADLVALRLGLKLEDLVRQKFNEVSDRRGSDIKL